MRRSFGKGLSQLIAEQAEGGGTEIAVSDIHANPYQPRKRFDEVALQELAGSIATHGLLQPIVVRRAPGGGYELIMGERRLRAARALGLASLPAVIRDADDQASLELALIENLQREEIGPVESAYAYQRLIKEFGLTQEAVASRVGKSRVAIANHLRLLGLPVSILKALNEGMISEGHGRALLGASSSGQQEILLVRILADGLSVREVEALVKANRASSTSPGDRLKPELDPNWTAMQERLSEFLATPVTLHKGARGGKLTIDFYSDDELERLISLLGLEG